MKKLLFIFPIVALLAAGCNSSQQVSNQPPVQTSVVQNTNPTQNPTSTPATNTSTGGTYSYTLGTYPYASSITPPKINFSFQYPSGYGYNNVPPTGDFFAFIIVHNSSFSGAQVFGRIDADGSDARTFERQPGTTGPNGNMTTKNFITNSGLTGKEERPSSQPINIIIDTGKTDSKGNKITIWFLAEHADDTAVVENMAKTLTISQ